MNFPGWSDLAAMMTVLAIIGGLFTWIVSIVVDRKLTEFSNSLRRDFVSQKELDFLLKKVDEHNERYERTFRELWASINELRNNQ